MAQDMIEKEIRGYCLTLRLGEGAFGDVYLAEHVREKTLAAVKVLRVQLDVDGLKKFINEASATNRLIHPHIVRLLDFGTSVEGTPFLILEYAPNGTLRDRLQRQTSRRLPLGEALTILSQIGPALQYAHDHGVVHRDLKPANILFNAKDEALLVDFGIAVILENEKTMEGLFGGTVAYMAPEQFKRTVSPKSDQYALGCIAYEMLTGQRPFAGDAAAMGWQHEHKVPIPPRQLNPDIPKYIEQAILKAMEKDRKDRFSDISAFVAALNMPLQPEIPPEVPIDSEPSNSTIPVNGRDPSGPTKKTTEAIGPEGVLNGVKMEKPKKDKGTSVSPEHKPSKSIKGRIMLIGLALLVVVLVVSSVISFFVVAKHTQTETENATATATSRAQFSATASTQVNPIVATMGILKLDEPLTKNSKAGWDETRGACTFAADGYHVIGPAQATTPQMCIARNLNTFSDFTFQVQMNILKGTAGGILFRLTSLLAYYFRISKDGNYALVACTGTDCSKMLVSNLSSYYDPHKQPNTLAVVVRGMHIELFVNNVRIDSVDDSGSLAGKIGVVAETGSEVVFREAKVWTPTPPPLEPDNTLHMFWRGSAGDQHIYWTRFDGTTWSPQQRVSDAQTSNAPTLAFFQSRLFQSRLFMVWRGPAGDQHIYWASFDGTRWSSPQQIHAQTSNAPALAFFQDRLFMAWIGQEGDPRIYWANFDGTTWSPQLQVPGVRTSNAPALAIFQNRLFMVWKGIGENPNIYWASFDGSRWSSQQQVPGVEASSAPTLAIFQNRLFMVWKGLREDPGIYWASFDGARWSSQQHVPGMVGTSSAPAVAIFQNRLFMVWKGIGENTGIYWASFDGTTWSPLQQVPDVGTDNAPTLTIF